MAKEKETDQLTRWAVEATKRGMTYGAYVAKYHPEVPPAVRFPQRDKFRKCAQCGAPLRPESNAKYCGLVCQANAKQERLAAAIVV